jgi:hypothetical protein
VTAPDDGADGLCTLKYGPPPPAFRLDATHDKAIQIMVQCENLEIVLRQDLAPLQARRAEMRTLTKDDTPPGSPAPIRKISAADVGKLVAVDGYSGYGAIRFVGPHVRSRKLRIGVEMETAFAGGGCLVSFCSLLGCG